MTLEKNVAYPTPKIPEKTIGTAVSVSYHYSVIVSTICRTYPVHPAIKHVSDFSTCFPEGFTYEEYVVHPNPA